jgi:hypothetical protein
MRCKPKSQLTPAAHAQDEEMMQNAAQQNEAGLAALPHSDIRKFSAKEYFALSGAGVAQNRQRRAKQANEAWCEAQQPALLSITEIETTCPDSKVSTCAEFILYASHMHTHYDHLRQYYGRGLGAGAPGPLNFTKARFNLYTGKQRAMQEAVNMLFNCSKKYGDPDRVRTHNQRRPNKQKRKRRKLHPGVPQDEPMRGKRGYPRLVNVRVPPVVPLNEPPVPQQPPVQHAEGFEKWRPVRRSTAAGVRTIIAYGDASFDNLPGNLPGGFKKYLKQLKRRARQLGPERLLLVPIGENHTSCMCSKANPVCRARFAHFDPANVLVAGNFLYRVRTCETCGSWFQRDVGSCRLIGYLFLFMQRHGNMRPQAF